MSKTNQFVFTVLHIIAWMIFVGLCIEAGGLIVNFIFSIFKPEMVSKLYDKMDLSKLYAEDRRAFYSMYSFAISISVLKAVLFYVLIDLLLKLDLNKPFSDFVAQKIIHIAEYTFSIGLLSYIAKEVAKNLEHHGHDIDKLNNYWVDSQAFILMAAIVYVIGQIFKRGVELQNENDLTV